MNYPIPTFLFNKLNEIVNNNFANSSQKIKQKIFIKLFSLWYTVLEYQLADKASDLNFFTNIDSKYLDNRFYLTVNGVRYHYDKLILLMSELIITNKKYGVGKFSKSYRIEKKFINGDYTEVKIDVIDLFDKKVLDKKDYLKKYKILKNNIENQYNLTINLSEFIEYFNKNKGLELKPKYDNKGILKKRYLDNEYAYECIVSIIRINFNSMWFKRADSGRLYSSISNLHSKAIPFIYSNKEKLVSLDVSNCQPLLLSILTNNAKFKNDCERGKFYNVVAKYLSISRDKAKLLCYRYIFFNNDIQKSGKVCNAINTLYPGLMAEINKLKENNISHLLQSKEAEIFVNSFKDETRYFLTRHDEILCLKKDKAYFKKKIKHLFSLNGIKKVTIK